MGIVDERKEHVRLLCVQYGIQHEIRPESTARSQADIAGRKIRTPAITMVRSYYTALHEIAHIALGYDFAALQAPQEAAAWQWAIANAIEHPTEGLKHGSRSSSRDGSGTGN
jgi:hypothetical protein